MNPWAPPTIDTRRLTIRPFRVDDFEAVWAFAKGHPAAVYGSWLGGTTTADVARYVADTVARYGRPPRLDLGVTLDGALVGSVAFRQVWISPPAMEIGWVLAPELAGRGIGAEAVGALVGHLFGAFGDMVRVEARVRLRDAAGVRLLERIGFVREGVLRSGAGEAGDAALYGLLRHEHVA